MREKRTQADIQSIDVVQQIVEMTCTDEPVIIVC